MRVGELPVLRSLTAERPSATLPTGGEAAGRRRLERWLRAGIDRHEQDRGDLRGGTSRLSPYLHFGCLSPAEVAERARSHGGAGASAFVRQLAWRDFYAQVLDAVPALATRDLRPGRARWRQDPARLEAWKEGVTGIPILDAAMRQLRAEGWMANRSRLLVASFLTKTMRIDWRAGAAHFMQWLTDGDVANNAGNWQWMAGTGTDTRPNRVLNPLRQAARFDPDGTFVRAYVPELAGVPGPAVHRPWRLEPPVRRSIRYPDPIVDPDGMGMPPARSSRTRGGGRSRSDGSR
jgi:deoxyribodipyrimidine photo-lyase